MTIEDAHLTIMKPQNVVKQLIGDTTGWDTFDTMSFQFVNPSKFLDFQIADINFESGIVALQAIAEDGDLIREQRFAIKATLKLLNSVEQEQEQEQGQLPLGNLGAL